MNHRWKIYKRLTAAPDKVYKCSRCNCLKIYWTHEGDISLCEEESGGFGLDIPLKNKLQNDRPFTYDENDLLSCGEVLMIKVME